MVNIIVMYKLQWDWETETERRVQIATDYFRAGYNCSQSVAMTFADLYDIPDGGGIGRMRETCGSALGMFMLAGLEVVNVEDKPQPASALTGWGEGLYPNQELKKKNYEVVQRLAADFRAQTGSIICKELLGLNKKRADGTIPEIQICATPEPRTEEYYRKRPCIRMVETATRIYINYLKEKYTNIH